MSEDLEFAKRTEEAWKEIEEGKLKEYSVEEYFRTKQNLYANQIDTEGEITDWAKKELKEARDAPDSELISSEDVKKIIGN